MAKTRRDVIDAAYRQLALVGEDENLPGEKLAVGGDVFDSMFAELTDTQGLTVTFASSAMPDALFVPLARLLATDLAPIYSVVPPVSRGTAMGRVRAYLAPDDRPDLRDLDDDGIVSDAEKDAGLRALYF